MGGGDGSETKQCTLLVQKYWYLCPCSNTIPTIFVVLLTQKFGKLLETFVFLSVNLTIFAKKFLSQKWKKKKKKNH